jgi:hypothetical protein
VKSSTAKKIFFGGLLALGCVLAYTKLFSKNRSEESASVESVRANPTESSHAPAPLSTPEGLGAELLAKGGILPPAASMPKSAAKDASVNPDARLQAIAPTKDTQALANLLERRSFSDRFRKNLIDSVKVFQLASQGDESISAETRNAYHQAVVDEIAENPDAIRALLSDLRKEEGVSGTFAEAMLLNMSSDALPGEPKLAELIRQEMIPDASAQGKPFPPQEANRQLLLFSAALKHFSPDKTAELTQFRDRMIRYHPSMALPYLQVFETYYPGVGGKAENR